MTPENLRDTSRAPRGAVWRRTPAGPGVAHPTACGYRKGFLVWQTRAPLKGSGAIGSAPVSKTGGCGFESRLPC